MTTSIQDLSPHRGNHGEGPIWDWRSERILWVDMLDGLVLSTGLSGDTKSISIPDRVAAFVRLRIDSGHIVMGEHSLWQTDLGRPDPNFELIASLPIDSTIRANDGGCSPDGNVYAGTMGYGAQDGVGQVWRIDRCRNVEVALSGTTISNGMRFIDNETVAFIDSPTKRLSRYKVSKTGWRFDGVIADLDFGNQVPDGMCMDSEGAFWIAFWDGGCVRRISRFGEVIDEIELPTRRPTSCALVGSDLRTLVISTSQYGLPMDELSTAGRLYAIDVEVPGNPDFAAL